MAITDFTPKTFTNDGGEPINAANLNEMQRVLDALNKAGLTQVEILKLITDNSASKNYVQNYKKPWDITKNVGRINVYNYEMDSSSGCEASTNPVAGTTQSSTDSFTVSFPAINSGRFLLDAYYAFSCTAGAVNYINHNTKITIYINNTLIKEFKYGTDFVFNGIGVSNALGGVFLDVKDGDIIKLEYYLEVTNGGNYGVSFYMPLLALHANIDTPYKYIYIPVTLSK